MPNTWQALKTVLGVWSMCEDEPRHLVSLFKNKKYLENSGYNVLLFFLKIIQIEYAQNQSGQQHWELIFISFWYLIRFLEPASQCLFLFHKTKEMR